MLNKVEVRNSQGSLLVLPLEDIEEGLLVEEIQGLDPVKATLVSSSFAGLDGEQYQSSRRETRNIKLRLGLEPDPTVDSVPELRNRLYGYFMPKSELNLRFFMDGGLTVDIVGRVETLETAMFTAEPTVDISMICYDPDFLELDPEEITGNTTNSMSTGDIEVIYSGSVEAGFEFTLNVNRTLGEFSIYHTPPNSPVRTMDFSASLLTGDVLKISTVTGNKGATLTRTGVSSSILYAISPQSKWFELLPGENRIRVYAEGAAIPFELEYRNRYGGL